MSSQPRDEQPVVTIAEAARILGVSTDAIRKRVERGSMTGHKGPGGRWYVQLSEGEAAEPGPVFSLAAYVARLETEVAFLRSQLERTNEHLERAQYEAHRAHEYARDLALRALPAPRPDVTDHQDMRPDEGRMDAQRVTRAPSGRSVLGRILGR